MSVKVIIVSMKLFVVTKVMSMLESLLASGALISRADPALESQMSREIALV